MLRQFEQKTTCLKALMELFIIVMHAANLSLYTGVGGVAAALQNVICYNLCEAGVPLLLFISGFLMYRTLTKETMRPKLIRRVRTLLVPYLLFNLIYLVFFAIVTRIPAFTGLLASGPVPLTAGSILKGLLLNACNPAAWFLLQLILFAAACPILYPILKRPLPCLALTAGVLVLSCRNPNLGILRVDALAYYLIGAAAGLHQRAFFERRAGLYLRLAALMGLMLYEAMFYSEALIGVPTPAPLARTVLLLSVYFLADALDWTNRRPILRHAFFDYVLHMLPLGAVRVALYMLLPHTAAASLLSLALSAAGAVWISEGIARLMERFLPRAYAVATGARTDSLSRGAEA